MQLLGAAFVYLVAAVIAVPLAKRAGLGSVLGYLIAGVVIGPLLGIVGQETVALQHFAEFGVVMMLFVVGLELRPSMLWNMRRALLGLGGLQVLGTTALVAGAARIAGLEWQAALALGMILALSSTAIILQTLNEKGLMRTRGGRSAFAVLLTQDIAVIPMLALLPLLIGVSVSNGTEMSWISDWGMAQAATVAEQSSRYELLPLWGQVLASLGGIAAIVLAGRTVIRPVFRFIAESQLREIFTAAALMLVIGIAVLMTYVDLSPALGTFLAGVVLSDSEYRHELESDIEPFKGLLLGLFFITVGAGIDFGVLFADPLGLLALTLALMALKAAGLYGLGRVFGLKGADLWLFTLSLAQAGEFAFVLFDVAADSPMLSADLLARMTLVVALSMMLTPALFLVYEHLLAPRLVGDGAPAEMPEDASGDVVVAGLGRVGQIVTRLLMANGHEVTVLDHDPQTIENLAKIGFRAYYGDATRPDLLEAAGLREARLFVAALDDRERQTQLVAHVARTYPGVTILARARDRHHVYELENAGAHHIQRETFEAALDLGRDAMVSLGYHPFRAETIKRRFRRHDIEALAVLRMAWNAEGVSKAYIDQMRVQSDTAHDLMRAEHGPRTPREWGPQNRGNAGPRGHQKGGRAGPS